MKFEYIYGKESQEYDYLYIPKAFMKDERYKTMSASAKILYALLLEKQQESAKMGWIDENNHTYIMMDVEKLGKELNWDVTNTLLAIGELEDIGLLELENAQDALSVDADLASIKAYLKRFV